MSTVVAIHQPNFFPWLGYFDKICKSDIFVFMDNVQFPRASRGTWINRVKMLISKEAKWIICPIKRGKGVSAVNDISIDNSTNWKEKMLRTIEHNYKKTPCFDECWEAVKSMVLYSNNNLSQYNIRNIKMICGLLNIDGPDFIAQAGLNTHDNSTQLLIEIVKKVNGDTYLCGGGASGYQEDALFATESLELIYQNFKQPSYRQYKTKEFIKGLSILDCLFNLGMEGTRKILNTNGHS